MAATCELVGHIYPGARWKWHRRSAWRAATRYWEPTGERALMAGRWQALWRPKSRPSTQQTDGFANQPIDIIEGNQNERQLGEAHGKLRSGKMAVTEGQVEVEVEGRKYTARYRK
jgi:hypothetical protein